MAGNIVFWLFFWFFGFIPGGGGGGGGGGNKSIFQVMSCSLNNHKHLVELTTLGSDYIVFAIYAPPSRPFFHKK